MKFCTENRVFRKSPDNEGKDHYTCTAEVRRVALGLDRCKSLLHHLQSSVCSEHVFLTLLDLGFLICKMKPAVVTSLDFLVKTKKRKHIWYVCTSAWHR